MRLDAARIRALNLLLSPRVEALMMVNDILESAGSDLRVRDLPVERRSFERHKAMMASLLDDVQRRGRLLAEAQEHLAKLDGILADRDDEEERPFAFTAARRVLDVALGREPEVRA